MMLSAIGIAWAYIRGGLAAVPWQVWACIAALALIFGATWFAYSQGYDAGRESVLAELREAETKAAKKAVAAIATEGAKGAERAAKFDAEQETLSEAIRKAEDANQNALDALF